MKKSLGIILSIIIYIIVLWILMGASVVVNFAIFGRPTGGITAFGGIASIWLAYKFVKWLRGKYIS